MVSWARRSRAAATIFMARVIFCVFLTDTIRLRIALRLGMSGRRLALDRELLGEVIERGGDDLSGLGEDLLARLLARGVLLVLVEGLARAELLEHVRPLVLEVGEELG